MNIPIKCPICEGKGYHNIPPIEEVDLPNIEKMGPWRCKTCNEKGILWAYAPPTLNPPGYPNPLPPPEWHPPTEIYPPTPGYISPKFGDIPPGPTVNKARMGSSHFPTLDDIPNFHGTCDDHK